MKSILEEAKKLHQSGHLIEAEKKYLEFLQTNPDNDEALHHIGLLFAEAGDLDKAHQYLQKAANKNPNELSVQLHFANILKAQGLYDQAIQVLQQVIHAHPDFPATYNNLGTVYFAQGKFLEAVTVYQKAIDLQSNYVDAYYNLGLAFGKLNKKEDAMNVYEALIELAPQHAAARFQFGCLLMEIHKYKPAIEHFSVIEQNHPFHVETQTNLATCYLKIGYLNEAEVHYKKALELTPDDLQILFNLGVINMQQGRLREASEYYEKAVKAQPDYFEAQNNLATVYVMMRNMDAALLHFRKALSIQPNNTVVKHMVDILSHEKNISISPPEYIRSLFDSYADHYDAHLVNALQYQVPQLFYQTIHELIADEKISWDILDLGCGTGLCGELFKADAHSIVGIDLSQNMLDIAEQKKVYDKLVRTDILSFLINKHEEYDLILAGDVLVYFGDLKQVFSSIASALTSNGLFIFNTEINDTEDYAMTASGRFAHNKEYLNNLAENNKFNVLYHQVVNIRTQDNHSVSGYLYVLKKQ